MTTETKCTDEIDAPGRPSGIVQVWDTQYVPSTKAFSVFREAICSTFMPWTPEYRSETNFAGRAESVIFEKGSIGRSRMSPLITTRTKLNIANSPMDCIYGSFVLAGELSVEQAGRTNIAKPGDLIAYDSSSPVTMRLRSDTLYEDLAFSIPKCHFAAVDDAEGRLRNTLLKRDKLIDPLSSCLAFIAENLLSSTADELSALYDAVVSLLPLGAGCFDGQNDKTAVLKGSSLLREILGFVNRNILDADLSARGAAAHFNVSARYVHKLLARSGATFNSYVMAKRLDHIRCELVASSCRRHPISELAYRWGFNDLSTFNRAFKQRFGCTPTHFRMHLGR